MYECKFYENQQELQVFTLNHKLQNIQGKLQELAELYHSFSPY